MTDGSDILRELDRAVSKARRRVNASAQEAEDAREMIIKLQKRQATFYAEIADERLKLLDAGRGGDLGYIDREAVKRLEQHHKAVAAIARKIAKSDERHDALLTQRAAEAKIVDAAVEAYNKAASAAEAKLRKTADYKAQYIIVSDLAATANRAQAKLKIAREDEVYKTASYMADPIFSYLHGRDFGMDSHKGWFFTRWLDGIAARRTGYKAQAETYRHITDIPLWLNAHFEKLLVKGRAEEDILHNMEAAWFKKEGVTAVHKTSILAQKKLDKVDEKIAAVEDKHEALLTEQAALIAGEAGPYKEAVSLMAKALSRHGVGSLNRLASQTVSQKDDRAVFGLRDVLRKIAEQTEDHKDAMRELSQRRNILKNLQSVRRSFKTARFDSYSSAFEDGYKISNMIDGVLVGSRSSSSLWKQMKRKHYIVSYDSDDDDSIWSSTSSSSSGWFSSSSSSSSSLSSSWSSSSSGSGFSTGGGFGGGSSSSSSGFSTGGGF